VRHIISNWIRGYLPSTLQLQHFIKFCCQTEQHAIDITEKRF